MSKNKKITIGILIAIIIVISIIIVYKTIERSITNRENFDVAIENISPNPVDTVDMQNVKESEIEKAIKDYLVGKRDNEYKCYENEKTFVSMKIYSIEEKSKKLYNIYAWVLEEQYYLETNEIKLDTGSSIPCKFVIENIDGKFTVKDTKIPRDGNYYVKDIKRIFPSSVVKAMHKIYEDGTMENLKLDIQKQTQLYFYK